MLAAACGAEPGVAACEAWVAEWLAAPLAAAKPSRGCAIRFAWGPARPVEMSRYYLKGVVMCQQPWAFLFLCHLLSHVLSRVLKRWPTAKNRFFSQDVSYTHGFVCTHLYIRISFRKILISLLIH